jgi:hypothetical protein
MERSAARQVIGSVRDVLACGSLGAIAGRMRKLGTGARDCLCTRPRATPENSRLGQDGDCQCSSYQVKGGRLPAWPLVPSFSVLAEPRAANLHCNFMALGMSRRSHTQPHTCQRSTETLCPPAGTPITNSRSSRCARHLGFRVHRGCPVTSCHHRASTMLCCGGLHVVSNTTRRRVERFRIA